MEFSTNLKCEGCVAAIREDMDAKAGQTGWEVDLTDPARKLIVHNTQISENDVINIINKAGFKAAIL
jgi:copper chaperone